MFEIQVKLPVYRCFADIGFVASFWDPQADSFGWASL